MPDFPDFVRNANNRIASASQFTDDIEGWVFDGADGSPAADRVLGVKDSASVHWLRARPMPLLAA